jgi:hypothetical protein
MLPSVVSYYVRFHIVILNNFVLFDHTKYVVDLQLACSVLIEPPWSAAVYCVASFRTWLSLLGKLLLIVLVKLRHSIGVVYCCPLFGLLTACPFLPNI